MDKLQKWLRRIQQPPRREVANLDYWSLLTETRIALEADLPPERVKGQDTGNGTTIPRRGMRGNEV